MRSIDAAIKDLEMIGDCRTCGNKTPFCDSNPDGCSGYKWRGVPFAATDDSRPLTLEELRQMDGEPVCITSADGSKYVWMLVDEKYKGCRDAYGCFVAFKNLGKTWLAYRRKPEEGWHGLQRAD